MRSIVMLLVLVLIACGTGTPTDAGTRQSGEFGLSSFVPGGGAPSVTSAIVVGGKLALTGATGHMTTTGTAPTLSSCGTSPAIAGTDIAGLVTTGTAGLTCTITFAATYTNEPSCQLYPVGVATVPTCTVSATAIMCSVTLASQKYHYQCVGLI